MNDAPYEKDILLAEDDADDVFLFEMALKELNIPYLLRNASNGEVLFVLLKEKIPYILFLDVHMPCKDGVACVVDIRKNRDYDSLPIIMYTSNFSDKIIEECYRNGANVYLKKTTTFAELTEKLRKVFSVDWTNYLHYPPQNQFVS
jgi:CheY-like chemotaxis protein